MAFPSEGFRERLRGWLASRRASRVIVALAVLLCVPSLTTGLVADDYVHQCILGGGDGIPGLPANRLDLFTFASGIPARNHALVDAGVFPWWTDPEVKLAFFRPLSALTHLLDHLAWPSTAWMMHAENLLWFMAVLLAVGAFYRRFLTPAWLAGLALLLYAVDDAHGPAVGWVANRNALVAISLALPAVALHDRYRREGWRPGRWLAPLMLALGLLAGESAIAATAYRAAHALHVDRGTLRARLASLWPYAGVTLLWRALYGALGYGTRASGVYFDPSEDPRRFLLALPERLPHLVAAQFALPWSDFSSLYPSLGPTVTRVMLGWALVVVAVLVASVAPLWRRDPITRFFVTGTALSLLPISSTFAADRLLWFVGVGAMGIVAQVIAHGRGVFARAVAAGFIVVHLVLAPPLLALRSRSMDTVERALARANDSIPRGPEIEGKTLVLMNPPADPLAGYVLFTRAARGEPRPERLRWLATGAEDVRVTRADDRTLRVRPEGGFLANVSEWMLRSPARPMAVPETIPLTGVSVDVTERGEGERPSEAVFRFDRALEDPSLVFMQWSGYGFVPFPLPALGASVVLPRQDFLKALFGPGS